MNCGFSISANKSSVEFAFFGARTETRLLTSFVRWPNGCAALMGRIHYRDQLLSALPSNIKRETTTNDAALALAIYSKSGVDGICRLEGDYCLVIWDERTKKLFATRDPMGAFPIFWTSSNQTFTAATAIAFLDSTTTPHLDPDFIADYLSSPVIKTQDELTEASIYKGIRRVMPGRVLTVQLPDLSCGIRSAWNWSDHIVEPRSDRSAEIAEQFEPLLHDAVRERIAGTTAAHFSGGMDSTAIALIANGWIGRGIGEPPLHALSLVYKQRARLMGETAFIDCALAPHPNIVSLRIEADDLLPYDDLAEEFLPDEPYAVIFARAKERALAEAAASNGIDTILTGCGGDDVFDVAPFHIADMLRAGHLGGCWHEFVAWGKKYGCDTWTMLRRFGLLPLLPASLQGGLRSLLRRGRVAWRDQGPTTIAPWLLPSFVQSHHMYERGLSQLDHLYQSCRPVGLSVSLASVRGLAADPHRGTHAQRGIMLTHPFMDPRILSLALGVRLRYRPKPDEQKSLLAHAMRNVLPDEIRNRRDKVNYNEVYYRGLARNLRGLEDIIQTSRIGEIDLINRDILIDCVRQMALGCEINSTGGVQLILILSLLTWLSIRERTPSYSEPPAETIRISLLSTQTQEPVAQPC